jgi:prepilin-type N-terminal cleavage/methylation domain-containing protein
VNERGFTLAELLVASAVLGFLMLGVFTVQRQGLAAYQVGAARVEVQQNARAALETMFGEIRAAQLITAVPAGCGQGPAPANGGNTISFNDQNDVAVQYQLPPGTTNLQRNGTVLIGGVQSFQVWCYDSAGALTATPLLVRSVHVRITTQTESTAGVGSNRNQHAVMETRVRLRNL